MWIVSTVRQSQSLRTVKLDLKCENENLPFLRDVLGSAPAELSLNLNHRDDFYLWSAVEEAGPSLKGFELTLMGKFLDKSGLERLLGSVESISGLRRFVFVVFAFKFFWPSIEAFISDNTNLDSFGLGVVPYDSSIPEEGVMAVSRGLRRNRRLRTVTFCKHYPNRDPGDSLQAEATKVGEATSKQIVKMLHEGNTTLLQIKGLEYESREHEDRINYLLKLNRYGKDFALDFHRVPLDLLGDVLSRSSNADCNCVVTEMVKQASLSSDISKGCSARHSGRCLAPCHCCKGGSGCSCSCF
jgi:hypothetical protein